MVTVLESLKGINAYPIPFRTMAETAVRRGIDLYQEADDDIIASRGYRLSRADLLLWLSFAPAITQGGQSYSFTDEQRQQMRNAAQQIYDELEEEDFAPKSVYGYKGNRL